MKKTLKKTASVSQKPELPLYRDSTQPVEARVEDLLSRMTLEEKIGQMNQFPCTMGPLHRYVREGSVGSILSGVDDDVEAYMHEAVEETRLGIPLLVGIDAIHGHSMEYNATIFPSQLALSCSWDEAMAEKVARACAEEMSGTGCAWTFSPVFCMARDLRWGRVDETFGEDPLLIGKLGAAMIRGYQGKDLAKKDSVAACAKHFAGYGETMGGREAAESEYSRRKLESVYLPPFHEAAKAGCASFMTAYHALDGVPCTINHYLLTEVLRDRWHSDAIVVTDWCNVAHLMDAQNIVSSPRDGAAPAIKAGNDLSMTTESFYRDTIAAVKAGELTEEEIDVHVRRLLALKFRLGLFENPRYPSEAIRKKTIGNTAHRKTALEAARASAVLLKNDNTLPLRMDVIRKIAVIGCNADDDLQQLGDWVLGAGQNQGMMNRNSRSCTKTILDGILNEFGKETEVSFARGAGISESRPERIARAERIARKADLAVVVLSDNLACTGEGRSTATLELQGDQLAMLDAVAATGTPIVAIFMASKPLVLTQVVEKVDALLCIFNPGMEGGTAVADILRGRVNPTGRLSVSFPAHVGQQPCCYSQVPGAHHSQYPDLRGYGFYGLFPFGFGLSYTSMKYYWPSLSKSEYSLAKKEAVELSINVRNAGDVDTVETVQVYFRDVIASCTLPEKRLIGFQRVPLKSGEMKTVTFRFTPDQFSFINAQLETVTEPGEFKLMVGANSRDVRTISFRYV